MTPEDKIFATLDGGLKLACYLVSRRTILMDMVGDALADLRISAESDLTCLLAAWAIELDRVQVFMEDGRNIHAEGLVEYLLERETEAVELQEEGPEFAEALAEVRELLAVVGIVTGKAILREVSA